MYGVDWACEGLGERDSARRTVQHFQALERFFEDVSPDVVVPEVGLESLRSAAHLIGLARGTPVLFLFYTIFPNPLRLYVDRMEGPIAAPEDLRPLEPDERREVEDFVQAFTAAGTPIREHRETAVTGRRIRALGRHLAVKALWDQDNEYLRPLRWARSQLAEQGRFRLAKALCGPLPTEGRFVYFPLHVIDDYKIRKLVPHCADQAHLIHELAWALPPGVELVTKEHPMSIGRNPIGTLRRTVRPPNVRLVDPHTSSHELIRRAAAVAVIGSTVGLEALLYRKPVLTLGRPFYSGFGLTVDVDPGPALAEAVPALLSFSPPEERLVRFLHAAMRRCEPGAPVLVDRSDRNAALLAQSLEGSAARELGRRAATMPGLLPDRAAAKGG
ncbi:MAG: hypothetical protein WKF94_08855 [Solirubrobacteraceae bacterium]